MSRKPVDAADVVFDGMPALVTIVDQGALPMQRPPYQDRVIDERDQLRRRITRLDAFIHANPGDPDRLYLTLPADERERLGRQLDAMRVLESILNERVSAFTP